MSSANFFKENKDLIKYGVGLLAVGFVGYKLLQKFGIISTQKDIDDKNLINSYSSNSVLQVQQAPANNGRLLNDITLKEYYKKLVDAHGFFNDNEENVYSVFRSIQNKAQLEQLIAYFNQNYESDLFSYLENFLSDSEFAKVLALVKQFN